MTGQVTNSVTGRATDPATEGSRCPFAAGEAPAYPFGSPDRLEPDPYWEPLRREQPLQRVTLPYGGEAWLATRYQDVRKVFADRRFSRALAVAPGAPRFLPHQPPADAVLSVEGPDHARLRRLVGKVFTPRRVEAMRPLIQSTADRLLDAMEEIGPPADLVEDFSLPFAVSMICELLGVPPEDRKRFCTWSDALLTTTAHTPAQVRDHMMQMHDYLGGLVAQRRTRPTEDLIGSLVTARDAEDKLTEGELVRLAEAILIAGYETSASQIPNFLYVLFRNPHLLERLRNDHDLIPDAVEELLRYVPIGTVDGFPRTATEDVELGGVLIRAGETVVPSMGAANRDPELFADPEELDLTRSPNPHLGFGAGPHHCLGAQLARVELQITLTTLFRRYPRLRLAVPEESLSWKAGLMVRGMHTMPITW
ncbi:cytochrome P450 [Streptomyces xantholiticus]|uniref:cytochrome P450 n=1 Tax=Streptomyces xantholiticus TaxID=68285 RepID=UPI0019B77C1B|nr:cytochrome P450 [Streptomyces xantholiticus]GGW62989.1 cytochrome P450 [Streptomyces xantholiticus]